MPVYDKEKRDVGADELRDITGISPRQERAMGRRGRKGAARDILEQERNAARGGTSYSPIEGHSVESGKDKKSKKKSPDEVNDSENKLGKGYTGGEDKEQKKKRRFGISKRGGLIGGSLFGGGLVSAVALFSITSGPMRFIHISQNFIDHDFGQQDDANDDKVMRIMRYAWYNRRGETERTRLGVLGNKLADTFEARFNSIGMKSAYTPTFGYKKGFVIDRSAPEWKDFSDDKKLKEFFKSEYNAELRPGSSYAGVPALNKSGIFVVDTSDMGYFQRKAFYRASLQKAGMSRLASAIATHALIKRDGISLHPGKIIDKKLSTAYEEWAAKRAARQANGEYKPPSTTVGTDDKSTQAQRDAANSAKEQADATNSQGADTNKAVLTGDRPALLRYQDAINTKWGQGGLAALSIPCLLRALVSDADTIKQQQVMLPLIRVGMEYISLGQQVMAGQDIDTTQLDYYLQQLDATSKGSTAVGVKKDWTQARPWQAINGNPGGGTEVDTTLQTINEGTPFDFLDTPPIGPALDVVCHPVVQAGVLVLSFIGGPTTTALNTVAFAIAGPPVLNMAARWLAGAAVDVNAVGADLMSNISFGSRAASNEQALSMGGSLVSPDVAKRLDGLSTTGATQEFQSKSLAYRLFNPKDYHTPVAKFIDSQSSQSMLSNMASITRNVFGVASSFGSTLFGMASNKSSAAGDPPGYYDYHGMARAAIDPNDNDRNIENPYESDKPVGDLLDSPGGQKYIDLAKECNGLNIVKDPDGIWSVHSSQGESPTYKKWTQDKCKTNGDKQWAMILDWINSVVAITTLNCRYGDDASCADIGFNVGGGGAAGGGNPSASAGGGDAKSLAQTLLDRSEGPNPKVQFQSSTKDYLENIARTGQQTECGKTVTINPDLLDVLVKATDTFSITIGVFAQGHGCGNDEHIKGNAVDINGVGKGSFQATTRLWWGDEGKVSAQQLDIIKEFYHFLTFTAPEGQGGIGQRQCFALSGTSLPSVRVDKRNTFFSDRCNHIHFDVRKQ